MTPSDFPATPRPVGEQRFSLGGPGHNRLSLTAPLHFGVAELTQLELDLTGRAGEPASRRRGRVQRAELVIDEARLNRELAEHLGSLLPLLPPLGPVVERVQVRLLQDESGPLLHVLGRLRDEGTALWCSLRARLRGCKPDPGPLRSTDSLALGLVEEELRVFGLTSTPAPLLGLLLRWVVALGLCAHRRPAPPLTPPMGAAEAPVGLRPIWENSLWVVGVDLLHDALMATLPRAGYRAADPSTASLCTLRVEHGRLYLGYRSIGRRDVFGDESPEEWSAPPAAPIGFAVPEVLALGDRLLQTGDCAAALAIYTLAGSAAGVAEMMQARRLQVLLTAPSRQEEAELQLGEVVRRSPQDGAARLALALLAGARGELATAARLLGELGEAGAGAPDSSPEERALALLTAARCLTALELRAAAAAAQAAVTLLTAAPARDEAVAQEAAELAAELVQTLARSQPLPAAGPAEPAEGDAIVEEPELILQRAESETLPAAVARIDRALRTLGGPARLRLCLGGARLCQQRGEIARARLYLEQAGEHPEALHLRVQLDLPELTVAEPGEPADLLPVLQRLARRGLATRDELVALAQLHSSRGQHRDAFAAQRAAGGDPEELLGALEAAGQPRALVDALLVHARLVPERAAELYRRAARVAQQQLADPARAASLWQTAAAALVDSPAEAAVLWAHAGHLWQAYGSYDRSEAALRSALELGGEQTPLVLLALGHHAYAQADLEGAADAYRRALAADQVPPAERPQVFLRLAEIEHEHGDAAAEERELAAAVEAGGGALAWPALAALFRAQGDGPRLGAALLGWADYETGEMRRALLTQAAALCGPSLLGRADQELTRLDADDEAVRDRIQTRLRQAGSPAALLRALLRDLDKSRGLRRLTVARELRELAGRLGDDVAAARAHIAIIEGLQPGEPGPPAAGEAGASDSLPTSGEDALAALTFLTAERRGSGALPEALGEQLRDLLLQRGRLRELLSRMDRQLALLTEHPRERSGRAQLLRQTAELAELLGDSVAAATRWLRLCATDPEDRDALARCRRLLRRLATAGEAPLALALCETELRRDTARRARGLRVIQAELLVFLQRPAEALAQLELVLMRAETFGPAHAVLGLLLASSADPGDAERSLEHLLLAAYAPDVEPAEAGECALVAAALLTAAAAPGGLAAPSPRSAAAESVEAPASYLGRAAAGTWVAVPADFLEEALSSGEPRVPSTVSPTRPGIAATAAVSDEPPPQPPELPRAPAEPRALLGHAAALLPADPRPLEELLALAWSAREYGQALSYCDRLLALARSTSQRARLLVEKAYVLLRTGGESTAHALLDEALALIPEYPPALRALRLLVRQSGDLEQAVALLQRELHAQPASDPPARAALLLELGQLHKLRGDLAAAQEAFRSAGQLGSAAAWRLLAEQLLGRREFLGAADALGRAAAVLPAAERGAVLVEAAQLAVRADDELRARDHLEQAVALGGPPSEAARALLLELDGGPDAGERRRMLERRLQQVSEGIGYLDVLARLLLLCRAQGDEGATRRYGEALLAQKPGDELALCALAEQAYRQGRLDEAEALLAGVTAVPEMLERPGTLLRCLAELRVRRGDLAGAERAYGELLTRGEHDSESEAVLTASTALAELLAQRGAFGEVTAVLKVRLLYLPAADSAAAALRERVALRLRIAEAAERGGDLAEAEQQLGCVLDEQPGNREALRRLYLIYAARRDDEETLATLESLIAGAASPRERGEWLSERAALLSERGAWAQATQDYQQILGQSPGDGPTLKRLAELARRAAGGGLDSPSPGGPGQQVGGALTRAPAPPGAASLASAAQVEPVAGASGDAPAPVKSASALAAAFASGQLPVMEGLSALDAPLAQAQAAFAGDAAALTEALRRRLLLPEGLQVGVLQALARQAERASAPSQHVYLALLAFLAPGGAAEARLAAVGPRPLAAVAAPSEPADEEAPWLRALALLMRLLVALPAADLPLSPEWGTRLLPLAQRLGIARLSVALVDELPGADEPLGRALGGTAAVAEPAPARCDPTRPLRLRLRRELTAELGQAHFAALRALHLYCAGEPLLHFLSAAELAALVQAAAALWIPGVKAQAPQRLQALLQGPPDAAAAPEGAADTPAVARGDGQADPGRVETAAGPASELDEEVAGSGERHRVALPLAPAPAEPPAGAGALAPDLGPVTRAEAVAVLSPCLQRLQAEPQLLRELRPLLLERVQKHAQAQALTGLGDVLAALRVVAGASPRDGEAARQALTRGELGELVRLALRIYGSASG